MVAISESWLVADICDAQLAPVSSTIYRADRSSGRRRGGALLGISNVLGHKALDLPFMDAALTEIDVVAARVIVSNVYFNVFVLYIPRSLKVRVLSRCFEEMEIYVLTLKNIIILGDFNIPSYVRQDFTDPKFILVHNFITSLDLVQVNNVKSVLLRMLDLVLISANIVAIMSRDDLPLVPEDVSHPALQIDIQLEHQRHVNFIPNNNTPTLNFRRANYVEMYAFDTVDHVLLVLSCLRLDFLKN